MDQLTGFRTARGVVAVSLGHSIIIGMALLSGISLETYKEEVFGVEVFWLEGGIFDGNDVWQRGIKAFNSTKESGLTQRVGDWAVHFFLDGHAGFLGIKRHKAVWNQAIKVFHIHTNLSKILTNM